MRWKTLLFVVLSAGCLIGAAPPVEPKITGLQSPNQREREAAQLEILRLRHDTIQSLVRLVEEPRRDKNDEWLDGSSTRNRAIYCLGEFRAPEAIPSLLLNLEPPPGVIVTSDRIFRLSPAAATLVKIGKPSVASMMEVMKLNSKSDYLLPQARLVVFDIEGFEGGKLRFQQAIADEGDPAKKRALAESLEAFEKELRPK